MKSNEFNNKKRSRAQSKSGEAREGKKGGGRGLKRLRESGRWGGGSNGCIVAIGRKRSGAEPTRLPKAGINIFKVEFKNNKKYLLWLIGMKTAPTFSGSHAAC